MKKLHDLFHGFGSRRAADESTAGAATPVGELTDQTHTEPVCSNVYNLIIVDESGSMYPIAAATVSGVNEVLDGLREAQRQFAATQRHMVNIVTFNSAHIGQIGESVPIDSVEKFTDYRPSGNTPLYDAVGDSLTELRRIIGDDRTAAAVVTIVSDGMENASRRWSLSELSGLIKQLKSEGWSFSYMGSAHNVERQATALSISNFMTFAHTEEGSRNTWLRERGSKMSYFRKLDELIEQHASEDDYLAQRCRFGDRYYAARVTPERIVRLEPGQVFVFGSNARGNHGGGAALQAVKHFGAVMGCGEGLQGQSYAIPTMEGLRYMRDAVETFTEFAANHPEMQFLVTAIGCGIAGYSPRDVAPLFKGCIPLENVCLPQSFWSVLGLEMTEILF